MNAYMVIAQVAGIDYMTKVYAESESGAEHRILDMSVSGKHTYGVTACMAYDHKAMKCDTFIYTALKATPVSFEELEAKIKEQNQKIMESDAAEDKVRQLEKSLRELAQELEAAKAAIMR